MKISSFKTIVLFFLAALLGAVLFATSQNVQNAEDRLKAVRAEILAEQEAIGVLEVEWEYLNRPQRLESLANSKLKMRAPKASDMARSVNDHPVITPQGFETLQIPRAKPKRVNYRNGGVP